MIKNNIFLFLYSCFFCLVIFYSEKSLSLGKLKGSFVSELAANESELDEIEGFLNEENNKSSVKNKRKKRKKRSTDRESLKFKIKSITDLAKKSDFENIAVIQPKYFSKTKKFEFSLGATTQVNDAFFSNFGGSVHLGYYFSEKWGLDLSAILLSNSQRKVTDDLAKRGVVATTIVAPKAYYGLSIKWVPIYGKMSFLDDRIIPFDFYFSLGGGITQTNQEGGGGSAPTVQVSTGQLFSLSKKLALRWDFSWNFYSPKSDGSSSSSEGTFNNLLLTVGLSYTFPNDSNSNLEVAKK